MDAVKPENETYDFPDQVAVKTWDETIISSETGLVQHGAGISPTKPIQSSNYKEGISGYKIDTNGNVEFEDGTFRGDITGASGTFSGTLTGGSLNIPDTTTDSSFHVEADGDTWWGNNVTDGHATAPAKILKTGDATFSSVTVTGGSITGTPIAGIPNNTSTDISLLDLTHNLVFSVTDKDTVAWATGTITLSNGRTFSITGSNTGNMSARTYIYLDTGISSTLLQTTTTTATAMGANKKLIAVAQNGAAEAQFQVNEGIGGLKLTAGMTSISNNDWQYSGTWSVTDADTVAWGAGTLSTSNGGSYSIGASNTGNMSAKTYVYFDLAVSSTAFQTTTTSATAIGDGKILIAICQNATGEAKFMVVNDNAYNIDAANIVAGSITSNEIAASTIVAGDIAANTITANELSTSITYAGSIIIDTAGLIRSGQTDYRTGTGWWLGNAAGTPKFSIGVGGSNPELFWDGSTLQATNINIVRTFTTDEDLTVGQTVGFSSYLPSGRVARAGRRGTTATIGFTAEANLNRTHKSCSIGGDKFVFLETQASDDSLYATVGSINTSTKTVTVGTSLAVTADIDQTNAHFFAVCKLDTDKFIVFYLEDASTTIIKYRVGTVSGTTISYGSAATAFTAASTVVGGNRFFADQIGTDKGVFGFKVATETNSRVMAFTVTTTTATVGTAVAMGTNTDDNLGTAIKKIGTDKFVVATASGYCQIGTISGTTITLGTEVQFTTTIESSNPGISIVSPATDVLVIGYEATASVIGAVAATVSGTTPTFGTALSSVTSHVASGMYLESASSILVFGNNRIEKLTLSGNTLTDAGVVAQLTSATDKILGLDNGYFIQIGLSSSTLTVYVQGMSNNFIGFAQATASRGNTVNVMTFGQDSNQSGLIPGASYQANLTGGLQFASSGATIDEQIERIVVASSATSVII